MACDVLVAGGGPAGLGAASAAAARGARVTLLEKYGFLGGLATAGQVGAVCGLPPPDERLRRRHPSVRFPYEFLDALARRGGTEPLEMPDGDLVLPYDGWVFRRTADEWVAEATGVVPLLHATLVDVAVDADRIVGIRALVYNRLVEIRVGSLVDCTGSATAAHMVDATVVAGEPPPAPGVVFGMEAVGAEIRERAVRLSMLRDVARAVDAGRLPAACASASLVPGSLRENRVDLKLSLGEAPDGEPWRRVTELEILARRTIDALHGFLTSEVAAFRDARLGRVASQIGLRIDHRVLGRATLTEEDVLEGRTFEEGVAWGTWPIEEWSPDGRPRVSRIRERRYYEVPLGCLRGADMENLWMAGKCISATRRALASARVIGTAMSTGWAAGTAAAFQAMGRSPRDAIEHLRGGSPGTP